MIFQAGQAIPFVATYTNSGAPATGLTVTYRINRLNTNGTWSLGVATGTATEGDSGEYGVALTGTSTTTPGFYICYFTTTGTVDAPAARYAGEIVGNSFAAAVPAVAPNTTGGLGILDSRQQLPANLLGISSVTLLSGNAVLTLAQLNLNAPTGSALLITSNDATSDAVVISAGGTTSGNAITLVSQVGAGIAMEGTYTLFTGGDLVGNITGSMSGDVAGKILGGGASVVTGYGAWVTGTAGAALGTTANQNTLLTRIPGTIQPQTGDAYARLGAPAGASTAADIAAVKSSVGTPLQNGDYKAPDNADIVSALGDLVMLLARTDPTSALTAIDGVTAKLATTIAQVGTTGVYQFTAPALALAPTGSGGGGGGTINVIITPLEATIDTAPIASGPLDVAQYSAQTYVFVFNNADGTPVNLAGHALKFIAATATGTKVITYTSPSANLAIGGTSNNNVTLAFDAADTATVQNLTYWLWDITSPSAPVPLGSDCLAINPAVSPD